MTRFQGWLRAAPSLLGQREIGIAVVAIVVWLSNIRLPAGVLVPSLDSSWGGALGIALRDRMQFGVDVAFTYGPLGSMFTSHYDPDLFWVRVLVWEIGLGLLVATMMTLALARIPGVLERSLAFALLAILPISPFPYALLAVTAAPLLLLDPSGKRPLGILALTFVLAAFALVKFPLCVVAAGCVAVVAATRWREGARGIAAGVVAAWVGWFLLLWILCGQSFASLLPYLRSSVEISSGYEEAMSASGGIAVLLLGVSLFGLLGVLILVLVAGRPIVPARWAIGACLLAVAFVAFKSGFIRAAYHTPFFFGWVAIAGFLFPSPPDLSGWRKLAATHARLALAILGIVGLCGGKYSSPVVARTILPDAGRRISTNVEALLGLKAYQAERAEHARTRRTEYALPRTREKVGRDPIDMVSYEQGFLFLNDLAWKPRPVFQGYCAMTPALLERNARFLESPAAPTYVLFRLESIDRRLATMDDGLVLQDLARDWRPVLQEEGLILLRHEPRDESADPPQVVLERRAGFAERVELPVAGGTCHVLALDIRYSLLGRLAKTLLRAPPIFMGVETDAGDSYEARIVPGMMRTGAIIDPWLPSQKQWLDWETGRPVDRTVAVTVREPSLPWMFERAIGLRLTRRNGIVPIADPALGPSVDEPGPAAGSGATGSSAPSSRAGVQGEEMSARAPTDIRFDLDRGEHVARGTFGLAPTSWIEGGTDGATFSVVLEEANGARRLLFHKRLDPRSVLGHREPQEFSVRFASRSRAKLHLVTGPGPKGDLAGDWAWWRAVEVSGSVAR